MRVLSRPSAGCWGAVLMVVVALMVLVVLMVLMLLMLLIVLIVLRGAIFGADAEFLARVGTWHWRVLK
jgi:hypothetical protein